jgi:hypothetical protein
MRNPNSIQIEGVKNLPNTREVWSIIGAKGSLSDFGIEDSEKDSAIDEFLANNEYTNL